MSRYVSFRDFDWPLLFFILAICGLGVLEIRSATEHTKFAGAHIKQVYWIIAGVGAMFLVSLINYQALLDKVHWMYIAAITSLMAVMILVRSISVLAAGSSCRAARISSLRSGSS